MKISTDAKMNVCAIRRKSDGYYWQSNLEHGSGWTKRIRQSWTKREAEIEVRVLFERGHAPAGDVEVVELAEKRREPTDA